MTLFKKVCVCIVCILLCYALPFALSPLGLNALIAPMHVCVIICAMFCGCGYGFTCAMVGSVLSSLLSAVPQMSQFIPMLAELSVYAVVAGLTVRALRTGSFYINVLLTLVPTILLGRAAGVLALWLCYLLGAAESFSLTAVMVQYFTGAIGTVAIQMICIPLLAVTLKAEKVLKF